MTPPYFIDAPIAGVLVFCPRVALDERGSFVKSFHEGFFAGHGIQFTTREEFYSVSKKDVLRGMHFQAPPAQHSKLVTCLGGKILDVVLDLRSASPTFGRSWATELSEENHQVIYIPEGMAHGFYTLSAQSLVHYKTTSMHSPEHDRGIRWDSFSFNWPGATPILSARDDSFPAFSAFDSPF